VLSASYLNFESSNASAVSVDTTGSPACQSGGTATVRVSSHGIQAVNALSAFAVQLTSADDEGEGIDFSELDPHVYPYKLTLTAPSNGQSGGFRQLHISDISGFGLTLASTGSNTSSAIQPLPVSPRWVDYRADLRPHHPQRRQRGGQTNIELNVEVPHANTALLSAATGGAVQALPAKRHGRSRCAANDAQVSIARIDLSTLSGQLPGVGALEAVGAFNLQLGDERATYPLQLAIPCKESPIQSR